MRFVIDSNEYIFAFGPAEESAARQLIDVLFDETFLHTILIPRAIFEEVKRNLSKYAFQEFNSFINAMITIDEDIVVPFEIVFEYESRGLKPTDAFIAAYAEWRGVDVLVTENRHFLSLQSGLPFKILTAENCLKILNK